MNNFDEIIRAVRDCTPNEKQQIFAEIRDHILIHELENDFNVRAEIILEAIRRASDLTQRGIRGVIAETVFVLDILPNVKGWESVPLIGDLPHDACLRKDGQEVRIQVKNQRKSRQEPMLRYGSFVVEVQRTRTGTRDGVSTRPYRFGEFDLLAVCMQPSTKSWQSFMYAPAALLTPDPRDASIIATFQSIPPYGTTDHGVWVTDLEAALERVATGELTGPTGPQLLL